MLKLKLKMLASFSAITLAGSAVTSCGVTTSRLMSRLNDVNTFKFTYLYPLTNWSTGVTMQAEDGRYLNNLQGTLLTNDQYGRIVGDLAEIVRSNEDSTEWTFKFKDDAYWYDAFGNKMDPILGKDMKNAAFYVLNNRSISETAGLWETFVKGATELKQKLNGVKEKNGTFSIAPASSSDIEQLYENFEGITTPSKDSKEFTFHLTKGVPYFDTVVTYTAFAPLPDKAISEDKPNESYYNYGRTWRIPWYSGAYLVDVYEPTSQIILKKNPNYVNSSDIHVSKLEYTYLKNADVSRNRVLFESGDASEAIIAPTDSAGWNKYVGKDAANPIFAGATSETSPDPTTFNYTMNMANVGRDEISRRANLAMTTKSVRATLSNFLDRSLFAKYFSDALDSGKTSSFLRNVYTARKFVVEEDGTDYASYVEKQYEKQVMKPNALNATLDVESSGQTTSASDLLADGSDALYHNEANLKNSFKDTNPEITLDNLFNQVRKDLKAVGINDRVKIPTLMNGNLATTSNIYLENMIDTFNSIDNNPIEIVKHITVDVTEYQTLLKKGGWNLVISGWSPDYSDPSTYLNTYAIGGDLQGYTGTNRAGNFKKNGDTVVFEGFKEEYKYLEQNPEATKTMNSYADFSTKLNAADKISTDLKTRYEAYAEAEFNLIYRDYLLIPVYVPNGSYQVKLTYKKPFTQPLTPYGGSKYRFNFVELTPFLLTQRERDILAIRYEEQKRILKLEAKMGGN
ncbi:ABC transporter substrate-binding protein [Spiroplasma alleghenense]|uniref:Oligopeptide ABC transporter substrate-binding protein n=1 Tax=Spiroplasma alleghenense TaxID=216931 RepID=A0A345Z4F6_9MOLU|nr:ABC transporter substrate-binding protein [Spiroplasma alleghenense]AXK51485.1 oligopeptide ABC transporter substrate-binding protein [Spiroplasma alleghenense]